MEERSRRPFGTMPDGTQVEEITLRSGGLTAGILTYGGAVRTLTVPGRSGAAVDVALGFDSLEDYRRQGRALAAIDAIALVESGLDRLCSATVAVTAPPEVRVRRIMAREGIPEDYAWSRVRAQKPETYFRSHCGYVLVNDCASAEEFSVRARALLQTILQQTTKEV